jgi:FAD/FMN-containing dehydrogenase
MRWGPRTAELDGDLHARKVERVASALRARRSARPLSLRKRAVSHEVPKPRDARIHDDHLDVRDLDAILEIDPVARTCVAEPGVTFVDLVAATMRYGLVPAIVPELETITVGGAVAGCSVESASFAYGGFHDTCLEYEVVTARGEVLVATPDNANRLVFQMMHGTFGTLGLLSKLKFRLVPARPFVRVSYERHASVADYQAAIWRHAQAGDVDFMDSFVHGPRAFVLCLGRFVDDAPYTNRYDWTKVYYRSTRTRAEDFLRTPDYFFRYDRGVTNVHPRSFLGRLAFGKLLGSTTLLRLARTFRWLRGSNPDFILDVFIPFSKVEAFLAWYERAFRHFPLWGVPYRHVRDYEWLSDRFYAGAPDPLFLDVAIYGLKAEPGRNYHRMMEEKLLELGGMKTLISYNYYSEPEFWTIWNRDNYDRVKRITDPDNILRDLYTKTCRAARGA